MAWLEGWDQRRIKLTTNEAVIDTADLTWFRVIVTLSPTHGDCVFDELTSDANRFKIAFTKADGETQLYGEIEKWDDANESAIIHVSRDGWVIDYDVDTDFYMYYDIDHADNTDYIGDIGIGIDVGSACTDRPDAQVGNFTFIDLANPANYAGKITNVAIYAVTGHDMTSVKVATFYVSGGKYTARSASGDLGTVVGGTAQNFAVNLNVVAGDYIGIYFDAAGKIEWSTISGVGIAGLAGDQTACVDTTFDWAPNMAISLYATGATTTTGTNVWDGNSKMVQHMVDATTSTIKDSTSNNNNGTKKDVGEPASVPGKVGLGQDFDGANDFISIVDNASLKGMSAITIEAWINPDTIAAGARTVVARWYNDAGGADRPYLLEQSGAQMTFGINGQVLATTNSPLAAGVWCHIVGVYDSAGTHTKSIYINGELNISDTASSGAVQSTNTINPTLGRVSGALTDWFAGLMDEIHIDAIARTAGWIKAAYNSGMDTLLTYGSEETGGTILEFSETLSIVDTMTTSGTLAKAETLSIIDTKITSGSLGFIETLSIVDSWSGLLTFFETLSIADSKLLTGTLNLTETLEIVDSATYQCIKTFYETLSIIDTITTSGSLNLAETLSIVDSWTVLKTFFETLSITDTVAMGGTLNVSEIISIIDSFIRWIEHPIYTEPTKVKPTYIEPTKVNVSYTKPAKSNPIYTKPAKTNPIYTEPTKGHPVYTEPTKEIRLD